MHKLNMKHEKHPWFIRDSNPVPLGQKSGALTTELPGHKLHATLFPEKSFKSDEVNNQSFQKFTNFSSFYILNSKHWITLQKRRTFRMLRLKIDEMQLKHCCFFIFHTLFSLLSSFLIVSGKFATQI
jgi:predicted DNA-binding protein (MmcQ/YjbR family)